MVAAGAIAARRARTKSKAAASPGVPAPRPPKSHSAAKSRCISVSAASAASAADSSGSVTLRRNGLFDLNAGGFDHLGPAPDIGFEQRAEFLRRVGARFHREHGEALAHIGGIDGVDDCAA